ncbi:fibrous sheath CABYR-binding protein [Austrofundulus limnaeus]|uniref:ATP synthase peripheral stalk subunit F6, mitochondrial n=2 Tax=Austrofundulus limnaeus TaxID=52670 RepID=A0A2I4D6T2_AUSLI|nr:PREDICTED: fibrous sheath CABYR-binding protein-like [Austrofundulus limnaeus]
MATSLLRIGSLTHFKCLHAGSLITLSRTPAAGAFSTKSGGSKKSNSKKMNTDKKQPKTYCDAEKLIQHKSYEFPKKEVSSAVTAAAAVNTAVGSTPVPESRPNAAAVATVATTSDMKTPASVLEATTHSILEATVDKPVLVAEAIPAVKSDSESAVAGEDTSEAEVIAKFQPLQSSEPVVEVAPVAEAMLVIEAVSKFAAVVKDVGGPSVEASSSTTDITASEVLDEAVPEPLQEKNSFKDVPKNIVEPELTGIGLKYMAEAAPLEEAPEPKTKVAPTEAAPETTDKSAPIDLTPELVAVAVPVEPSFESMVEAAPQLVAKLASPEVIPEPVSDAAPVEPTFESMVETSLKPLSEAAPLEAVCESVVEASPVELTLEPMVEAATDSVAEITFIEVTPEPMDEAAPIEAVTESLAEASETETEVSTTKESFMEVVNPAPVFAEAAGEEMEAAAESIEPSEAQMDPIQKLFVDSIRQYSAKSQAARGLVDANSKYEKNLAQEIEKLQRLYGGGDLTSFPEFKFTEPKLDDVSSK